MTERTRQLERLIADMLKTFRDLARSRWVRIDLPEWEKHYRRKAGKIMRARIRYETERQGKYPNKRTAPPDQMTASAHEDQKP